MRNRDFPRFPSLSRGKALLENCVVLQFFDVASYKTQEALQAVDRSENNGVDPSPAHSRLKFKRKDGLRGRECRLRWVGEAREYLVRWFPYPSAILSATQAEYNPPPPPPHPPSYCRSTESNLLDETITMGCNDFLN